MNQPAAGSTTQQNNFSQRPIAPVQNVQEPHNNETSLDDLISGASKQAEKAATVLAATETAKTSDKSSDKPSEKPADQPVEEKKDKKEKSKASHLVYSDPDTSPEEKMARMPRYAFTPEKAR